MKLLIITNKGMEKATDDVGTILGVNYNNLHDKDGYEWVEVRKRITDKILKALGYDNEDWIGIK